MNRSTSDKTFIAALTCLTLIATPALAGCDDTSSSTGDTGSSSVRTDFMLGGLFPETGSLSYVAPGQMAAFKLAIKDINDAGGVLGNKIDSYIADVNDADHADQNTSAVQSVLAKDPSVIVGNPSSGVVKNTYHEIEGAKVTMISNGATAASLSGISDYFFRTVPPDTVQGVVLADAIVQDGVQNLAIACFNDEAGIGIRDIVVKKVEAAGVNVIYGGKDTFDPTEKNFGSLAASIKASGADAILVIAFDQTVPLVKSMAGVGIDTSKLYFFDGNMSDYSSKFEAGLLNGDKGTIPGAVAASDFRERLKTIDDSLTTYTFSAETYDAVVLAALAAQEGGSADSETIRKTLPAVSGTDNGIECSTYKECKALIKNGKRIAYHGMASIGAFNDKHDPSSAYIGVYTYDEDNMPQFDHSQQGNV
ncbi:ABC transporter substrate-binding protein [Bifidobacterium moukalabense]|uniref:Branched-chain amino acid transport system substrate-binding protein n=1 Tax=Bifidobacterium moukalabense DSM 27321 TaxID=1435051 RepID=W4NAL7_9BIFI|nr:ABC transporter substrate-binding protein [Bifidobacterium moukalabense]ETY72064.1 branched-chain amino acid transport system substrate-binding protein [Bifidobacterium moukalabense DSM 27321]